MKNEHCMFSPQPQGSVPGFSFFDTLTVASSLHSFLSIFVFVKIFSGKKKEERQKENRHSSLLS